MRLIAVEDAELEVDRAAEASAKSDSTDPQDIALVANYREEIEKLRAQSGPADDPDAGDTAGDSAPPEGDDPAGGDGATGGAGDPPVDGESPDTAKDSKEPESKDDPQEPEDSGDEPEAPEAQEEEGDRVEPDTVATEAIETAMDSLVGLHRIYGIVQRTQATGGLSPVAARYVRMATEAFAHRTGCPVPMKVSMEAFASHSTRETETQIVLEAVAGVAQRIWDSIKRFFAAIFRWVRDWIFGAQKETIEVAKSIKKTGEVLKAAEKKVVPAEVKERLEQKLYRAYSRQLLVVSGDTDIDGVNQAFTRLSELWTAVDTFSRGPMKMVMQQCMEKLDSDTPEAKGSLIAYRRRDFGAFKLKPAPRDMDRVAKNMFAGVVGPFPGGSWTVVQGFLDTGEVNEEGVEYQSVRVDFLKDNVEGGIPLLIDAKALGAIKKNIETLQKNTMSFYAAMAANNKDNEDFISSLLEDVKDGLWVNRSSEEVQKLHRIVSLNQRTMTKFMVRMPNELKVYTDRTITALLDYVNTCGSTILGIPDPKPTA